MIGKEDNQEEPVLKIEDKRKFNADGSLRDGVVIEKEEPRAKETVAPVETQNVISSETSIPQTAPIENQSAASAPAKTPLEAEELSEEDVLDDENPASFINFLSTLVTNAAASLGAMPHPATGQKSVDLETGKYWIDVLIMLREKTNGNLNTQEQTLFDSILSDIQLQYVQLSKAAEEKLKAQAAQKFSSKDILGG